MKKYVVYLDGHNRYVEGNNENDALRAALAQTDGATWRVNAPSPYGGTHYDVYRPDSVPCLVYVQEW